MPPEGPDVSEKKLRALIESRFESESLDYKERFDLNSDYHLVNLARHIMAMANTSGGYVVMGVSNDFSPVGLDSQFHVDDAKLHDKIDRYMRPRVRYAYAEHHVVLGPQGRKTFAILQVEAADEIVISARAGTYRTMQGKEIEVFPMNSVFVRHGSKSEKADDADYRRLVEKHSGKPESEAAVVDSVMETFREMFPGGKMNNLPRPDYSEFVGRQENLAKVLGYLQGRNYLVSIDGIGGVGKSALARRIAEQAIADSMFDAVVWVSAKTRKLGLSGVDELLPSLTTYEDLLDAVCEVVGLPQLKTFNTQPKEKAVIEILSRVKTLLVVDNLETVDDTRITSFLKDLPEPSKALVTSRKRMGEVERVERLKEMTFEESCELMLKDAEQKQADAILQATEADFRRIFQGTGGIPLALRWIVAWVASGSSLNSIMAKLKNRASPVLEFCFQEAFDNLLSKDAKDVLTLLPILTEGGSREEVAALAEMDADRLDDAIRLLVLLSLVNEETFTDKDGRKTTRYSMLPLTLGFAQAQLARRRGLEKNARSRLGKYHQRHHRSARALEQFSSAFMDIGATTEVGRSAALQANLAFAAYQRGNSQEGSKMFRAAVETSPNLAYTYELWALAERSEGNYGKAAEFFREATRLNPKNSATWRAWAFMEKEVAAFDKARSILQDALRHNPGDGRTIHSLAVVESLSGQFQAADRWYQTALIQKPRNWRDKQQNAVTCTGRAENSRRWAEELSRAGNVDKAREKLEEALGYLDFGASMRQGRDRIDETRAKVTKSLGDVLRKLGQFVSAEESYSRAILDPSNTTRARDHNAEVHYSRAKNFEAAGKLREALDAGRLALRFREKPHIRAFFDRLEDGHRRQK